jgi:hypothetical protein
VILGFIYSAKLSDFQLRGYSWRDTSIARWGSMDLVGS